MKIKSKYDLARRVRDALASHGYNAKTLHACMKHLRTDAAVMVYGVQLPELALAVAQRMVPDARQDTDAEGTLIYW